MSGPYEDSFNTVGNSDADRLSNTVGIAVGHCLCTNGNNDTDALSIEIGQGSPGGQRGVGADRPAEATEKDDEANCTLYCVINQGNVRS
jgi:hypothetical protein